MFFRSHLEPRSSTETQQSLANKQKTSLPKGLLSCFVFEFSFHTGDVRALDPILASMGRSTCKQKGKASYLDLGSHGNAAIFMMTVYFSRVKCKQLIKIRLEALTLPIRQIKTL